MASLHPDLRDINLPIDAVREALSLEQHPEGGYFRETWRDKNDAEGRGAASTILFMLINGKPSHWHRVDASEMWFWHAGSPMRLGIHDGTQKSDVILGPSVGSSEQLQAVVPANVWQEAETLGAWTVVACVVAPAFIFEGFEMAPQGWSPS